MENKIRVHGKSQSRTALGIVNAYLKLNPDSTPSEVQQAFPKTLNRRCSADNLIIPMEETVGHEKTFFEREDELIEFKTGEKYALVEIWDKDDFNNICEHAKQYGIEAAKEGTKPFERGSFELEYPDEVLQKSRLKWWWWMLLIILLLLLIFFCCKKCRCERTCASHQAGVVENVAAEPSDMESTENDSEQPEASTDDLIADNGASVSIRLPDGNVLELAKNSQEYKLFSFLHSSETQVDADKTKGWITMDKVGFESGKTILSAKSDQQLKNIARIMLFFPDSHLKIGGYTDNTGTDEINAKLSLERAKVTAEKIAASGIDANRLAYEGFGAQHPVCQANDTEECRAANRRVDIRVIQK